MYYTVIKHKGQVNGHLRTRGKCRVFSTFIECSQMTRMFYHSVIHGLGFFICFKIKILHAQNNKTHFFYVLYSDKTWVFDQSERAQVPIYILKVFNCIVLDLLLWDIILGRKDKTRTYVCHSISIVVLSFVKVCRLVLFVSVCSL